MINAHLTPEIKIQAFTDLTLLELYALLQLRSEVFVVEQNCVYQDLDDKDPACLHLSMREQGRLLGYCRLVPAGLSYADVSIGRVITAAAARGTGLGKVLMLAAIEACRANYGQQNIRISAQVYAQAFYAALGFKALGEIYLEDDIPHIEMLLLAADVSQEASL